MHLARIINTIINRLTLLSESAINKVRIHSNKVSIGRGSKITGLIYISNQGSIEIGEDVKINSSLLANPISNNRCSLATTASGKILISNNVGISGATIYSASKVSIGKNSFIGANAKILDTDFHSLSHTDRHINGDNNILSKEINISDNCFIGTEAIILKGVTIGCNSIVAAGSVVTMDIPSNEIWGGVPAKFIKKNTP